jgi:hypothetical protein
VLLSLAGRYDERLARYPIRIVGLARKCSQAAVLQKPISYV